MLFFVLLLCGPHTAVIAPRPCLPNDVEGFEGLVGDGRWKDVTLYKDECAELMAINGYGMLKVCASCVYR